MQPNQNQMSNPVETEQGNAVVSTSAILILSGFLLGISIVQPLGELAYYVFNCGITGLVAYLAFEMAGIQKERDALRHDQRLMEERLQRHLAVPTPTPAAQECEKKRLLDWLEQETGSLAD